MIFCTAYRCQKVSARTPTRNGKGASRMSSMVGGSTGTVECDNVSGRRKLARRATHGVKSSEEDDTTTTYGRIRSMI